jgi:hypothetical protein
MIVLAGAAAALTIATVVVAADSPSQNARDFAASSTFEMPDYGLEELVQAFDFAVVGTVSDMGVPQWNSSDGKAWENRRADESFTAPTVFTPVTVVVDTVIWSDISPPQHELTIWFLGDPSSASSRPIVGTDGFTVGEQRVFFVQQAPMPFRDGYTDPVYRSFTGSATWGFAEEIVWPHSHLQALELRALADAGVIGPWQPDPTGIDPALTGIPLGSLVDILAADVGDGSPVGAVLADVDPTRSLFAQDEADRPDLYDSEIRALDIEASIAFRLEEVAIVDRSSVELDPPSTSTPILTIEVTPIGGRSLAEVIEFLNDLIPPEQVTVIVSNKASPTETTTLVLSP